MLSDLAGLGGGRKGWEEGKAGMGEGWEEDKAGMGEGWAETRRLGRGMGGDKAGWERDKGRDKTNPRIIPVLSLPLSLPLSPSYPRIILASNLFAPARQLTFVSFPPSPSHTPEALGL